MRYVVLFSLAMLVCCSGQTCGGPTGLPLASDPSVIAEGIYTGSIQMNMASRYNTRVVDSMTETTPASIIIGSDGFPVTENGVPYYPGYQMAQSYGGGVIVMIVKNVASVNNGIAITYDAAMSYVTPDYTLVVSGPATEVYVKKSNSSVSASYDVTLGAVMPDSSYISIRMSGSGILTRG